MEFRTHQWQALEALDDAWTAGRRRAWVELPPGAGKTLVGLECARRLLADGRVRRVVVLGPNTAIVGQWVAAAAELGLEAGADRALVSQLTALTYQSLAVFDPDLEVDDDAVEQTLVSRLHDNGRALVAALADAGDLLLVLDECHHLLEVWGRLLAEVLGALPRARVLGLTATPPEAMTPDEADLAAQLFGETVFEASIPAVVREGDLAPFAELAWLTTPTAAESEYLAEQGERFRELVVQLTDPTFGSTSFLAWANARFLAPEMGWVEVVRAAPELADAALRLHHAGLLGRPDGARPAERHRHDPTAEDWVLLMDDWLGKGLARTGDPADDRVVEAVRRALPSVGYQWTRRGIRAGRSPVDRVLARSLSKTLATVQIVDAEHVNLGDRLRMLVLCDHERAAATVPVDLSGVLDAQSGSATAVLAALLADPATSGLHPLLVTGSTVAGAPATLERLRDEAIAADPALAGRLVLTPAAGDQPARLTEGWSSRRWVAVVTRFFAAGGTQVLVGTRALLGEGWDARQITGLVDLTAVTTATSVVQTRGRALRLDPGWPEKVALSWSVVCVDEGHPKGANDWHRLVRKHQGFYGVDDAGDVIDGVGHLDPAFSPFAPPPATRFDALNAAMTERSTDRAGIAARWRVGTPYQDHASRAVRLLPGGTAWGSRVEPATAAVGPERVEDRAGRRPAPSPAVLGLGGAGAGGLAAGAALAASGSAGALPAAAAAGVALATAVGWRLSAWRGYGEELLRRAGERPSVAQLARAVAEGLHEAGLSPVGADGVRVDIEPDGEYRCTLIGVTEAESAVFAEALDEALGPILRPRYVVPRWVRLEEDAGWWDSVRAAFGRVDRPGVVWHPVPSLLGVNARRATAYGRAWQRWVGGGEPVYTGSPEGSGILAAQRGADPFSVTSVMRRQWA